MKSFRVFLESKNDDYRGEHQAPGPKDGAPMHDLTANGIYPKDVYGPRGFHYYSNHGDKKDFASHNKVMNHQGKPFNRLRIYRAVPKDKSIKSINPGDWVTHNRDYAVEHGRANIGIGKWKILSTSARARDLYTDGNSIHEWGYHPQPRDEALEKHEAQLHAKRNAPEAIAKREAAAKKHEEFMTRHRENMKRLDSVLSSIKNK